MTKYEKEELIDNLLRLFALCAMTMASVLMVIVIAHLLFGDGFCGQ